MLRLSLCVLFVGCGVEASTVDSPLSARETLEGAPTGVGVLRFLNDASATFMVLDKHVPLDRRAAGAIVNHRDGADKLFGTADDNAFDTLAEVDDTYWVGDVAYAALVAYVEKLGWVPEGAEYLGTWEGVAFTVDEASGSLAWVNAADKVELDDAIDQRAVSSIIAARPLASILELSQLYFVGPATLTDVKAQAAAAGSPTSPR